MAAWLHQTTVRSAKSVRRMNVKWERSVAGKAEPSPETHSQRNLAELREILDMELARLPAKMRAAIVLCDLEGLKRKDAAGRLGLPVSTLSNHLADGRKRLRAQLAKQGLGLTVSGLVAGMGKIAEASTVITPTVVKQTTANAIAFASGRSAVEIGLPSSVVLTASGIVRAMTLMKLTMVAIVALSFTTFSIGVIATVTAFAVVQTNSKISFLDVFDDRDATDGEPVVWQALFDGTTYDASSGDFVISKPAGGLPALVFPELSKAIDNVSVRRQIKQLGGPGYFAVFVRANVDALVAYLRESDLSLTNMSVRTQFQSTGLADGIGVLTRANWQNQTGYDTGIGYEEGGWLVYALWQDVPNGFDLIHEEESALLPVQGDIVLQVDVFGDSVSVFAWPAGDAMPADPIVAVFDDRSVEGGVGIYNNPTGDSIVGFRYVRVANMPIGDASGDFDTDGNFTCDDIDLLYAEAAAETHGYQFDINNDALVNEKDITRWLEAAGDANGFTEAIQLGDSNLDGRVNAMDLNALGINWQSSDAVSWCQGDFNRDLHVDAADLNQLALNWQNDITTAAATAAPIPEPSTAILSVFAVAAMACFRQRLFHH